MILYLYHELKYIYNHDVYSLFLQIIEYISPGFWFFDHPGPDNTAVKQETNALCGKIS
jgi:hypothetical protein